MSYAHLTVPAVHPTVFLEITHKCSIACVYCGQYCSPRKGKYDRMGLDDFKNNVLILMQEFDTKEVQILGGEPSLASFYVELTQWCSEQGLRTIVMSNGTRINTYDLMTLSTLENFTLAISIQAGTEDVADKIANCPGSHRATMRTIEQAAILGIDVKISMKLFKQNAHTRQDLMRSLRRIGIENNRISF